MDAPKLRKLIKRLHKLRGQYQEYMDEATANVQRQPQTPDGEQQ